MRFGVVSDMHLTRVPGEAGDRQDLAPLRRAFDYFRDRGADAVVIAGDMADMGFVGQLESVARAWELSFPESRAPDGRHVERVFVTGNHDWEGCNYGKFPRSLHPNPDDFARNALRTDYAGNWERIFKEPYRRVYLKRVKGYAFVGAHWHPDFLERSCREKDEPFNSHVAEFYAEHGAELAGERPFFHVQHPHPKGTVFGPWASCDDGKTTRILSAFPNAVAISGHSHLSLTDERAIWQGGFTSIAAGSLLYTGLPTHELPEPGYENVGGRKTTFDREKMMVETDHPWIRAAQQGLFISVWDDRMEVERMDFGNVVPIGTSWTVPIGDTSDRPFDPVRRDVRVPIPEFVDQRPIRVNAGRAKNRAGVERSVLSVEIPSARTATEAHAYAYEVRALDEGGRIVAVRRVMAADFNLPAPSVALLSRCVFAADELPVAVRFAVRPLNSVGVAGRERVSSLMRKECL